MDLLFDISQCKRPIPPHPIVPNGKLSCFCCKEDSIPEEEISFWRDQRSGRKLFISKFRDKVFKKKVFSRRKHQAATQVQSNVQTYSTCVSCLSQILLVSRSETNCDLETEVNCITVRKKS